MQIQVNIHMEKEDDTPPNAQEMADQLRADYGANAVFVSVHPYPEVGQAGPPEVIDTTPPLDE